MSVSTFTGGEISHFPLVFAIFFVQTSRLPMTFYTHYHIHLGLLEGVDRVESCAHTCTFSSTMIATYKENVLGFAHMQGFAHLNLFVRMEISTQRFRKKSMQVFVHEAPVPLTTLPD